MLGGYGRIPAIRAVAMSRGPVALMESCASVGCQQYNQVGLIKCFVDKQCGIQTCILVDSAEFSCDDFLQFVWDTAGRVKYRPS